jgi:hypothetical protein
MCSERTRKLERETRLELATSTLARLWPRLSNFFQLWSLQTGPDIDVKLVSSSKGKLRNFKHWMQRSTSLEFRAALRRSLAEPLSFPFRRHLPWLATIYGSDKWGDHSYASHYARHFRHLRRKKITLLEIGIGGYDDPQRGGASLRMWRQYFPNAQIVGLDYFDKSPHAEKRIRIYRGDQSDENILRKIIADVGPPDIIIDDGSHVNQHVIKSFEVLFPLLSDEGIYVVEDTQTAYWPDFGGSSDDLLHAPTSMCFIKRLVDCLNYEEFIRPGYVPSYYDRNITSLHFYHNLVFIQKGPNQEGSNLISNNAPPDKGPAKTPASH